MNFKFEISNNKKYNIESIWDNAVYTKNSVKQLLILYYLILWKNYLKKENIWEPALAIQHFQKLTTAYYKNNLKKLIIIYLSVDMSLPITRLTALFKPIGKLIIDIFIKQKYNKLVGFISTTTKQAIKF